MIKNYTTTIEASKSIGEIINLLAGIGASYVSQKFRDGDCVAIKFTISHQGTDVTYSLEPNPEATFLILKSKRKRPNAESDKKDKKQSFKVSWRILKDWTDAQCALIQLEQATPLQLFLSYAWSEKAGNTFYSQIEGNLKLLN